MGAQIAAQFANVGIDCDLIDVALSDASDRNTIAQAALDRMREARARSPFFTPENADRIRVGNLENHLERLHEADWIIEAVTERLDVKRTIHALIDEQRVDSSIVSTNTSGLSIAEIAEGRSDTFRASFLGVHFFNPPRYTHLVEVIPSDETDTDLLDSACAFIESILGKGVVRCKDTPNFIANRVGIFAIVNAIHHMVEVDLTIDDVDAVTGPPLGRPRSGTFRLSDLIGTDILLDVTENIRAKTDDARLQLPPFVLQMIDNGWLGDKAGTGFYEKRKGEGGRSEIWTLDWRAMAFEPQTRPSFESLDAERGKSDAGERVKRLVEHNDAAGRFAWHHLRDVLAYAAASIPEIANDLESVDRVMRWGFNWELGPFELWDALGVPSVVKRMECEGIEPPALVSDLLESGASMFYGVDSVFAPTKKTHVSLSDERVDLGRLNTDGNTTFSSESARLIDIGDGVACLEFLTKMNTIDVGVVGTFDRALDEVEARFRGLVIGNHADHFSLGANLVWMLETAKNQDWKILEAFLISLQDVCARSRSLSKPVFTAPSGMVLGGGCEIVLGADAACAGAETNIGLVEVNVGLIPAGGGCKEMALRCQRGLDPGSTGTLQARIEEVFRAIALARVSNSGPHAQQLDYLLPTDRIAVNAHRRLDDAKQMVLDLAPTYHPPASEEIYVLGSAGADHLKQVARQMRDKGALTDYDVTITDELAHTLCGGNVEPGPVSVDHLHALERESFLKLIAEEKTHARVAHTLKTGKPLKN